MIRKVLVLLYNALFVLLLIATIALLVVTPIDTIRQSRASGQFWDVIIIVCAYVIAAVVAFFFYLQRVLNVRQSLANIPKRYMIHSDDIPSESSKLIMKERQRCIDIVEKTKPRGNISHPGLMNPKLALEESSDVLSAPYEEIVLTAIEQVLIKSKILHQSFTKPVGMSFRDYLLMLESYKVLDMPKSTLGKVINVYEKIRFSGQPITEEDFSTLMENLMKVLAAVHIPVGPSGPSSLFSSYDHSNFISSSGLSSDINRLRTTHTGLTPSHNHRAAASRPAKSESYESLKDSLMESLKQNQTHSNADKLKIMAQHYQQTPTAYTSSQYGLSRPSTMGSVSYPASYSATPTMSRNNSYNYSHSMYPVHTLSPLHTNYSLGDISSSGRSSSSLKSEHSVIIHRRK